MTVLSTCDLFWPIALFALVCALWSLSLHNRLARALLRERRQAREIARLKDELQLSHNMNGVLRAEPHR